MIRTESSHSYLASRFGFHTESPFTSTPAKRILSRLGFGLEGARNQIGTQRSLYKKAEWDTTKTLVAVSALADLSFRESEELIFGGNKQRHDEFVQPHVSNALITSDASQGEIDFLTGISKVDPRPMHKINYDAGNSSDRGVAVKFPAIKNPVLGLRQETIGEAQYRARHEGRASIEPSEDGHILKEKIKRGISLQIGGRSIPLFFRRQTLYHYLPRRPDW